MSNQAEILLTRIASLIAVVTGSGGFLVGFNNILSTILMLLSIVSVILVIAVNYDKGSERIKQRIEKFKTNKKQ